MAKGNILIGQSGGPTAVINFTLGGAISRAQAKLDGKIFGLQGGLEGLLTGKELLDLSQLSQAQIQQLTRTSAGALGSGRIKPSEEDLYMALAYLKRYDIRYFLYIGGNGSMQTPLELARIAQAENYEFYCVGAPKTIDNDLVGTDHAPGFGSAARWMAQHTLDAGLDLYTMRGFDHFKVIEAMGRNAGWLAAASVLARFRPNDPPHIILLPEITFDEAVFLEKVEKIYRQEKCCLVVASEGVRDAEGRFLAEAGSGVIGLDPVGKPLLSIGEGVAGYLCRLVKEKLGLKTRYDKPGTLQRGAACLSPVDKDEAFRLGEATVDFALQKQTAIMAGLVRVQQEPFYCSIQAVALSEVAGREKLIPAEYLEGDELNETAFRRYAAPLIGPALPEPLRLY